MNITLDQYLAGLERAARDLPELLKEWGAFDEDLADEYREQLVWMLDMRPEVLARAVKEGREEEIRARMKTASEAIGAEGPALAKIGVWVDPLLRD